MKRGATGLSEAQLQGKDRIVDFGNFKYFIGGDSTLGNLITAGIIPDRNYTNISRKPDGLIIKGKDMVVGVVEYKKPSTFKSDKQVDDACNQALEVARELDAKFIVATDGVNKSKWLNVFTGNYILDKDGETISQIFKYDGNIDKNLIKIVSQIEDKISASNNVIGEIEYIDPTPLAKKVWDRLYAATAAKPEDCLYTFVEMFIFKYLSDIGILKEAESFKGCLKNYSKNRADDLLTFYAQTIRKKIKKLFPEGTDGTTIINGTIFVNKEDEAKEGYGSMFRDILLEFKNFGELKHIDYEFKSKLFELFFKEDRTQGGLGQYFTPLKVVQQMVKMSDIREGMRICDPACGVGKFILDAATCKVTDKNGKIVKNNFAEFYPVENGVLTPKITIEGYDKGFTTNQARTIILAKANMLIYFSDLLKEYPDITNQIADLFNTTFHLKASVLGTLGYIPSDKEKYDLILANPPYMATGNNDIKNEIAKNDALTELYSVGGTGLEAYFMVWIINALKESGTAHIVIPDGILSRNADKVLRQFIIDNCEVNAIISLPINTFFSTSKKTYILSITKKTCNMGKQCKPVFAYLASSIGETLDANRFETKENDLEKAINQYNLFKGNPFAYDSVDSRCKILDFEEIADSNQSWIIEKFWNDEEKIALGMKKEEMKMSVDEFKILLSETSNLIENSISIIDKYEINVSDVEESNKKSVCVLDLIEKIITSYLGKGTTLLHDMDTKCINDYSVWSAAEKPIAYISDNIPGKLIVATEKNRILSISANGDGSAGRNFYIHTKPFYIDSGRIAIIPKEGITVEYLYYALQGMKERYGFCRAKPVNKNNLKEVYVEIPILENGKFDLTRQINIVKKCETVNRIKNEMLKKLDYILESSIEM